MAKLNPLDPTDFPTRVGVNRDVYWFVSSPKGFPHTCGGEPNATPSPSM